MHVTVMSAIIENKQSVSADGVLESYHDGLYFKNLNLNPEDITIEVLLYTDDFETGNPLGSRKGKHKLLGVYMTLLSLPSKYRAKLDNILLVALARSSLVTKYGIDSIFAPIVEDLKTCIQAA